MTQQATTEHVDDAKAAPSSVGGLKSGGNLERVLAQGHFAVTAELGPPKSMNTGLVRKKIGRLKGFVDAANVTDNQTGIVRLSSIGTGLIMVQEGLEPVIQMTCRDRNRLAIQSDLFAARHSYPAQTTTCTNSVKLPAQGKKSNS